jgi:hypothetical protein
VLGQIELADAHPASAGRRLTFVFAGRFAARTLRRRGTGSPSWAACACGASSAGCARVMADWTTAAMFRRDVAELTDGVR